MTMAPTDDDLLLYTAVRDSWPFQGSIWFYPTKDREMTAALNRLGGAGLMNLRPLDKSDDYVWLAVIVNDRT